jgi:hypothetical protein
MKKIVSIICLALLCQITTAQTQVTKNLTLNHGDGWYRIIEQGSHRANGMIRIWGTGGNNKSTGLTMFVSMMAYGQGGSINIVDNLHYNSNHIAEIRAGSSNGKYVVDVKFENINQPTGVYIQADGPNLSILNTPKFGNDVDVPTGIIEISGKVIGISSTRWPIYLSEKVGIGTNDIPSGYKLAVDGNAMFEEVKVQTSDQWPDYVFDNNYQLPDLESVKEFIELNGHLPEIPSAAEVEKNGINLGTLNSKLLQKIEELTLYQIQLMERLEEQNQEIQKLKELAADSK